MLHQHLCRPPKTGVDLVKGALKGTESLVPTLLANLRKLLCKFAVRTMGYIFFCRGNKYFKSMKNSDPPPNFNPQNS